MGVLEEQVGALTAMASTLTALVEARIMEGDTGAHGGAPVLVQGALVGAASVWSVFFV